jgi:hypothetical protein
MPISRIKKNRLFRTTVACFLGILSANCVSIDQDKRFNDSNTTNPYSAYGITGNTIVIDCSALEWNDIITLAEPYLNDILFTSLIQQGLSSGYRVSVAAEEALADEEYAPTSERMPKAIRLLLQAIVDAKC